MTTDGRTAPPAAGRQAPGNGKTTEMALDELRPGRYQPRRHHDEASLAELADSIREQGLLQPLLVRLVRASPEAGVRAEAGAAATEQASDAYEIVAGERRWRAAKLAGLRTVPVVVRDLDDQSALAVALIENLQREDLNAIDQAQSLARLADEFALTHEQVARAVGRSRASVSNLLRLLELTDEVKDLLAQGRIDMGHARALLPLDADRQIATARKAERHGWSVRQVEKAVKHLLTAPEDAVAGRGIDLQTLWLQRQLASELGQRVAIRPGKNEAYRLNIGFADLAQLQQALRRIDALIAQLRGAAGPRARDAAEEIEEAPANE